MASPVKRKLPVGIQTFRTLRSDGCYYVDKTAHMKRLIDEGTHYFLSRPRRFGKSLLVDTLKELFEGNEPLFRGLAVHEGWNWSERRAVVRLDFSKGSFKAPGYLHTNVSAQLDAIEDRQGLTPRYDTAPERLAHLLEALHERTEQRVAVLVDEYDRPILDALTDPDVAAANRDYLRGLYGTIKFAEAHIKFTLLTGVSKFTKVSLFSDLNNLVDITLEPAYATICGYTEHDLDTVFAPELPGLDRDAVRDLREVRQSLNGSLLAALVPEASLAQGHGVRLYRLLLAGDTAGLEALLRSFFANIPYQWHVRNNIADYEGYYASVFHAYFMALEMDVRVEEDRRRTWPTAGSTARGIRA